MNGSTTLLECLNFWYFGLGGGGTYFGLGGGGGGTYFGFGAGGGGGDGVG